AHGREGEAKPVRELDRGGPSEDSRLHRAFARSYRNSRTGRRPRISDGRFVPDSSGPPDFRGPFRRSKDIQRQRIYFSRERIGAARYRTREIVTVLVLSFRRILTFFEIAWIGPLLPSFTVLRTTAQLFINPCSSSKNCTVIRNSVQLLEERYRCSKIHP